MYSNIDIYVQQFCKDALIALKKEDRSIKENFEKTKYKRFYSIFPKGLNIRSITEPIIKYIVIKELVKKYKMWPEAGWFYNDKSILDLGISSPYNIKDDNESVDIAIEMKWGGIDKNGGFLKWSSDALCKDCIKMKNCNVENKYFMQFIVLQNDDKDLNVTSLRKSISNKAEIRLKPIYCDYFRTQGSENNQYSKFYILAWKVFSHD